MSQNTSIIWQEYPVSGLPSLSSFKAVHSPIPTVEKDGSILLKMRYISVDPYMRGRMRANMSGYLPPFQIGEPLNGGCVAEVIESKNGEFPVGQIVQGFLPWKLYHLIEAPVTTGMTALTRVPVIEGIPISTAIGVLGMPGMTAYFGLLDICTPKEGETVVVSGAAGAVGSLVGQIAKIKGCRTVGIAGSADKLEIMKEKYGYDEVLNYKDLDDFNKMKAALAKACPKGIDIYFDNTGGYISDAVMPLINRFARISICGQISHYNEQDLLAITGPRTDFILIGKSAKKEGFVASQFLSKYPEGIKQMAQWIKEGKIKFDETVVEGIENVGQAFIDMMNGKNTGKMIIKV